MRTLLLNIEYQVRHDKDDMYIVLRLILRLVSVYTWFVGLQELCNVNGGGGCFAMV